MTICIAALSKENDKEYVVFSTDHMVTTDMGQFEHSILKYSCLNKNTVAMIAGQALLFDDLVRLGNECNNYEQVKKQIFENFRNKRKQVIENEIFNVFGINQDFFKESLQKEIPNPFINTILQKVADFNMKTQILLVGFVDSVAQITHIEESGVVEFRSMNFHCIGSGSTQAANTLLFQKHSKISPLIPTIYNVYKAKKNAEVSEGVGKETELLVLKENCVKKLSNDDISRLDKIYKEELEYGKNHNELSNINIGAD